MAYRVLQYSATIPAGTLITAPATVDLPVDNWDLEQLDLEVPAGPGGLMGFYVANNGVPWIPGGDGQWLVWDDTIQSWPFADQPNASGWSIVGYNDGVYDHAVTVRFHVNPVVAVTATPALPTVTFVSTALPTAEPVTL